MATPSSAQKFSTLEGGEGFWRSTKPQARYQTWSRRRNHKVYHTNTWNWV